ncbi:Altered inheritance of mitochondria protein 9, mitochondrial [Grifola frondosa]|uniref:Altered inheritance of mitochondria protein 9, mitochondrial n=1 Tax=Grifola frondosa TaxID=5627 RepID=A0A1C7MEB7_GRIFR|nr:Altered inheritance of mitochondria protein 9, mitochondrial [Grifola frondosa]
MASIPSAATLSKQYISEILNRTRRDLREASERVASSLNLDALKLAGSMVSGCPCTGIYLTAQGGYNQIYMLTFEGYPDLIARVNGNCPLRLAATLEFLRNNTSIPVPKVLAIETNPHNPVNARYTIQERILGRSLGSVWPSLTSQQIETVVAQVAEFEAQLMQTHFPAIGCLLKDVDGQFSVGRMGFPCVSTYNLRGDTGPWTSSLDWIKAQLSAELIGLDDTDKWMLERANCRFRNGDAENTDLSQLHHYFMMLYRLLLRGVEQLSQVLHSDDCDPPSVPFVLHHDDLEIGNIMVAYDDPTRVVAIVDWEGSHVVPLWVPVTCDRLLMGSLPEGDQLRGLQELRQSIHERLAPIADRARRLPVYLSYLLYLASGDLSKLENVTTMKADFRSWLAPMSEQYVRCFDELLTFINADDQHSMIDPNSYRG